MGPGGSPGARLRVVEKFCPVDIHIPTTAVNNVPIMAPLNCIQFVLFICFLSLLYIALCLINWAHCFLTFL